MNKRGLQMLVWGVLLVAFFGLCVLSCGKKTNPAASNTAPQAPALSSPANGATGIAIPCSLKWNASSGAASYALQVAEDSTFATLLVNQSGITGTSYAADGLSGFTRYFWRVNATNAYGTSAWSGAWSFTTGQGQGWVVRQISGVDATPRGVHFPVDAQTGFVACERSGAGGVLRTYDGGANWAYTQGPCDFLSVCFPNNNQTGYIVGRYQGGGSAIGKTIDAGVNWNIRVGDISDAIYSVHFPIDANTGYNSGAEGFILKTTNAGANWFSQATGSGWYFNCVYFPDNVQVGYAVGLNVQTNIAIIAKTGNGGASWSLLYSNPTQGPRFVSVHFPVDAQTGYVVGTGGVILKTVDGGASWVSLNSGTTEGLQSVYFPVNAQTGYAAGGGSTILKTKDGGASWVAQVPGVSATFFGISFPVNDRTGYVVGRGSTEAVILKTTSGGS